MLLCSAHITAYIWPNCSLVSYLVWAINFAIFFNESMSFRETLSSSLKIFAFSPIAFPPLAKIGERIDQPGMPVLVRPSMSSQALILRRP